MNKALDDKQRNVCFSTSTCVSIHFFAQYAHVDTFGLLLGH
jgi:hypothetical protein